MADEPKRAADTLIRIADVEDAGVQKQVVFGKLQREEISKRLEIPAIQLFAVAFTVVRSGDVIRITGQLEAVLDRVCVASLEDMQEELNTPFQIEFLPVAEAENTNGSEEFTVEEEQPEPLHEDHLNLTELAIQQLSLEMDPYPRKRGAVPLVDESAQPNLSPFASLKQN